MERLKNFYDAHKQDWPSWQEFTIMQLSQYVIYLGLALGYQRENNWIIIGALGLGLGGFIRGHVTWLSRVRFYNQEETNDS